MPKYCLECHEELEEDYSDTYCVSCLDELLEDLPECAYGNCHELAAFDSRFCLGHEAIGKDCFRLAIQQGEL
jgi:hypothetical protein